jgi:small-conductance mechanosensitive channel
MRAFEDALLAFVAHEWVWRILVAVGVAVAGIWLARWVSRLLDRLLRRTHVEEILRNFLRNVAYAVVIIVMLVVALDFAGVPTTSLLAVIGAAGLGIGLALKDSLSNIASGVMLIVLRPFNAGDSVRVCDLEGVIDSVRIFQTRMHTVDNRLIVLPNSQITAGPIINYTISGTRRVDLSLGIAFGDDVGALRAVLLGVAAANRDVHASPPAEVLLVAGDPSHVTVQLRAWTDAAAHPRVQSELLEAALAAFAAQGLSVPRPMREVHVFHHGQPGDAAAGQLPDAVLTSSL